MDEQIQEPVNQEISEPEQPSTEYEVSLDEEGDVKFSDEFFGELPPDEPEEPQPEALKYYTREELENTPYEQWDFKRMPEAVRDYADILNQQTAARQQRQRVEQQVSTARPMMEEPKQYTAKELSAEASKLAMEKLGIQDEADIDEFDREYQSAFKLAQDELSQKRNYELSDYRRRTSELQNLQRFNAELSTRPDFGEFNNWYMAKCKEQGVTPQQVNAGLNQLMRENGERYSVVQEYVSNWYKEFQTEKASRNQERRRSRPPVLEGTSAGYDNGRSVNMRNFSQLDSEGDEMPIIYYFFYFSALDFNNFSC